MIRFIQMRLVIVINRVGFFFSSAHTRRLPAAVSRSDVNWDVRQSREASSSLPVIVRKKSLRNITPRSYSSLLKSESEEESEQENEATFKSALASAHSHGNSTLNSILDTDRDLFYNSVIMESFNIPVPVLF